MEALHRRHQHVALDWLLLSRSHVLTSIYGALACKTATALAGVLGRSIDARAGPAPSGWVSRPPEPATGLGRATVRAAATHIHRQVASHRVDEATARRGRDPCARVFFCARYAVTSRTAARTHERRVKTSKTRPDRHGFFAAAQRAACMLSCKGTRLPWTLPRPSDSGPQLSCHPDSRRAQMVPSPAPSAARGPLLRRACGNRVCGSACLSRLLETAEPVVALPCGHAGEACSGA